VGAGSDGDLQPDEGVCAVAGGVYGISGADVAFAGEACGRRGGWGAGDDFGGEGLGESGLCESSQLEITSVKQEGRKEISAGEFLRGARMAEGERFGK